MLIMTFHHVVPTNYMSHVHPGAMMGMMDAYEFDYDKMDDFIEELRERVGRPPLVNLTALTNRGKVSSGIVTLIVQCTWPIHITCCRICRRTM